MVCHAVCLRMRPNYRRRTGRGHSADVLISEQEHHHKIARDIFGKVPHAPNAGNRSKNEQVMYAMQTNSTAPYDCAKH